MTRNSGGERSIWLKDGLRVSDGGVVNPGQWKGRVAAAQTAAVGQKPTACMGGVGDRPKNRITKLRDLKGK